MSIFTPFVKAHRHVLVWAFLGLSSGLNVLVAQGQSLTITATSPVSNAAAASAAAPISASFNQSLNSGSAAALRVFSSQRGGLRTGHSGTTNVNGNVVRFTPAYALQPGETVQATMTTTAMATTGASLAIPRVIQFRTAATGGFGTFGGSDASTDNIGSYTVAVGDIDNDGDLDYVTGIYGGVVFIKKNNGNGTFAPLTSTNGTSGSTFSLMLADMDGDGDLDMVAANTNAGSSGAGSVQVRFNDGLGNFSGLSEAAVGSDPRSIAVGDVDGDGDLDVLASTNGAVSVRLNDGSGTLNGSQEVSVSSGSQSDVLLGDVDNDGDLDLLTAGRDFVSMRLNNGSGMFSGGSESATGSNYGHMAAGDVDGDGDLDIVLANYFRVSVRLNNGSGTFAGGSEVPTTSAYNVSLGDVDGDGDLDLLAPCLGSAGSVAVRINTGSGAFAAGTDVPVGGDPYNVALGDVDGDGDLDLVTANANFTNTNSVRFNQSTAPTMTSLSPTSGPVGTSVTITGTNLAGATSVSFNGTNQSTITANTGTSLTVTVPAGAITGNVTVTTPGGTSNGLAFTVNLPLTITSVLPTANTRTAARTSPVQVSFNQSVTSSSTAALKVFSAQQGGLRSNGSGTTTVSGNTVSFAPTYAFKPGETVRSTVTTAASSSGGNLARGKVVQFTAAATGGSGVFSGGSDPSVGNKPSSVAVGDVDGDGDLDLLTANYGDNTVSVRLNDGLGNFTAPVINPDPAVGNLPNSVAVGDVDGDGDLDFVTANTTVYGTVSVRLNNGTGNFTAPAINPNPSVGNVPNSVTLGDVDGDGDLDLLTANETAGTSTLSGSNVSVRLNDGTGNFTVPATNPEPAVAYGPRSLVLGDVDSDGDLDLLTTHVNNGMGMVTVSVRLNDGTGNFTAPAINPNPTVGNLPYSMAVGDVDGDGDLDLVTEVSVRLNNGSGNFSGGNDSGVYTSHYSVVLGDVEGDGDLDLLIANNGNNTVSVRLNDGLGVFSGGSDFAVGNNPVSVAVGDVDGDGDLDLLTANTNISGTVSVRLNQSSAPILTSLSPTSGPVGTSVTITGTNLAGATGVSFNGTAQSTITNNTATGLNVAVPAGATSGPVTVTTPGGISNGLIFTVTTATPTIAGFTPVSGVAGTSVILTGTNLGGATALTVNGAAATITANTATSLTFTVPAGASATQSIALTTPNGTATSTAFTALLQVTATNPVANAHTAPRTNSAVVLTFSEPVTAASIAPSGLAGLKVFSSQVGGRKAGTVALSGNTANYTSNLSGSRGNFMPGEVVSVTVPGTVQGNGGLGVGKKVVQFTTAVGGMGRGNFMTPAANANVAAGSEPFSIATGDVDGDGDLDAVCANYSSNTISIRLNDGTGVLTPSTTNAEPTVGSGGAYYTTLADVDNDGDLDLLSANGTVSVRTNNGLGRFTGNQEITVGAAPQNIAIGDIDGDGDLDLLTANNGSNTVSVRLNDGTGTFTAPTLNPDVTVSSRPCFVVLGDVDHDGDLDFLCSGGTSTGTVDVRLNNGNGSFTASAGIPSLATGSFPQNMTLGDVDGDGDLDFLTTSYNNGNGFVNLALNNGAGVFAAPTANPSTAVGSTPECVVLGDLDNDGDLDFVVANYTSGSVSVRFNNGAGVFTGTQEVIAGEYDPFFLGSRPNSVALGDMDGDGDLDFVTANRLDGTISIRLNQAAAAPTLTTLNPISGPVGTSVTITGTNLTGATSVSFNGTIQAAITNNTATGLSATVPVGATTGSVTVTTPNGTSNGLTFTVTAVGPLTWTGTVSTDWNVPGNWSTNRVPVATDDVVIPSGTPYQPTISAMQALHTLTINNGATVTLANTPAATLALGGNLVNNGSLVNTGPAGALRFEGTALQTVSGTSTTRVSTLQVGAGAVGLVLNSPVQVSRLLEVSQPLTSNGNLTLLSDRTGTALVHNVGAGVVLGTATVQRAVAPNAFAAGAAYRHFSSPVAATTIADFATPGFTPVVNALYNTDPDPSRVQPFPTVLGYEQTRLATVARSTYGTFDKGWFSPAALTDRLAVGRGYSLHINAAQTVDFVGTLNTGNYTLTLARNTGPTANEAGWALVGNPYPSPMDWTLVTPADRPGLDAALYVNEPTGPYSGHYSTNANGVGDNPRVASGQAFFVRVSQGQTTGQLTFRNSQRGTTPGDEHPFYRGTGETRPLVQLALQGTSGPADNLYLYAQAGATAAQDAGYDAVKLDNSSGLNLASILKSGEALAIDGRPELANAAIPLRVGVPASGTYTLRLLQALNLPLGTTLRLTDALTGQQTDLRQQASYSFTVTAGAPANGRFWLNLTAGALATASSPALSTLSVFPNPAHEHFTVLVPAVAGATTVQAELLNALGQAVRRQSANLTATGARIVIDATNLAVGVYSLRVQADSSIMVKRVVIQ